MRRGKGTTEDARLATLAHSAHEELRGSPAAVCSRASAWKLTLGDDSRRRRQEASARARPARYAAAYPRTTHDRHPARLTASRLSSPVREPCSHSRRRRRFRCVTPRGLGVLAAGRAARRCGPEGVTPRARADP